MMRKAGIVFVLLMVAGFCGCGYSPGNTPGVSFTISPPDGSIDQALDVTVTVAFDDDLSEPADWMDAFILKQTEEGPTICESVVYNVPGKRATCEHAELDPETNYLVVVTGLTAVNGQQTNFTTVQ